MKILSVNQIDGRGGAAGKCLALHLALIAAGHESAVLVGHRFRNLPGVEEIKHSQYRTLWGRFWMSMSALFGGYSGPIRGVRWLAQRWFPFIASPRKFWSWYWGREDFDFPGTSHLLENVTFQPDIMHLHNLHGNYFDLRSLPGLSLAVPTVITLHDAWLLAGHCAHSFDCQLWKTGCLSCSRLDIPPVLRRDGAAANWKQKQDIYRKSDLSLVCPSNWLADKVRQSILMEGAQQLKVIPNGVDIAEFKPGNKVTAREHLGWPQDAYIVMFAANSVRYSIWKDYDTMREAILLAGHGIHGRPLRFFAIGDTAPAERVGEVKIEFIPYKDSLTECYQAADVYLHAAKADTFPTTIIEALACGTPVVATAVGGIPEQIIENETGFLVPAGDSSALAERLVRLGESPELARSMGEAAHRDAVKRFSLERMVSSYKQLYEELIEH